LRQGQTSVGEGEEWVRGGTSTLALVRQNIVQALCTYAEAAKQQIIRAKHWQSSMLCVKRVLVEGLGVCPLRVHLLAIHISAQIESALRDEYYSSQTMSPELYKE